MNLQQLWLSFHNQGKLNTLGNVRHAELIPVLCLLINASQILIGEVYLMGK